MPNWRSLSEGREHCSAKVGNNGKEDGTRV